MNNIINYLLVSTRTFINVGLFLILLIIIGVDCMGKNAFTNSTPEMKKTLLLITTICMAGFIFILILN